MFVSNSRSSRRSLRFETYFNGELSKETDMVTSLQTGFLKDASA